MWIYDPRTLGFLDVNDAALRVYGYSHEEFLAMTIADIRPAEDLQKLQDNLRHERVPFEQAGEWRHRRKDGSILDVEITSHTFESDGRPVVLVVAHDATARKQIARELTNSEQRLRAIAQSAREGIVIADRTHAIVFWNPAATELFGYDEKEILGRSLTTLMPERYRTAHRNGFARFLSTGESHVIGKTVELAGLRKDGTEFPVELSISTWTIDEGQFFTGIIRDISARAATEALDRALRDAERTLTRTFNLDELLNLLLTSLARLVPYDSANVMLREGPSHLRMRALRGYGDDVRPSTMIFDSEANPIFAELIASRHSVLIADTATHPHWERRFGTERIRNWLGVPLVAGEEVLGLYSMDKSVPGFFTAEHVRLAEALAAQATLAIQNARLFSDNEEGAHALRVSEETYRLLVDNTPDVIFSLNREGRYTAVNQNLCRLLERPPEDIIGKTPREAGFSDAIGQLWEDWVRGVLATGEGVDNETQIPLASSGELRTYATTLRPIRDARLQIAGVAGISRDITERQVLEAQVRQSQKMEAIGQLAGGVAHDFNNLLTIILGYCELVLGGLPPGDRCRDDIGEIQKAGTSATALTRQLLAFSRKQIIEPTVLNLNAVVVNVGRMLQRVIGEDVELELRLHPHVELVKADAGQIEQILMNLVVNARDAMPLGGRLTIETDNVVLDDDFVRIHLGTTIGPHVMIAVTDTGAGMTPDVQARLFEPFFTTKPVGKGTGLGLASVFGIVKQNGGSIWVYSEVGRGSTFKIFWPTTRDAARSIDSGPEARTTGTETILIVEDNPALRRLACRTLAQCGYTVLDAADASEALKASDEAVSLDLLLTDIVMPGVSGAVLASELATRRPGLAVLFMSGYTDETVVRHGVLEAGTPFLQKPYTAASLARKVRDVLDAAAGHPTTER